MNAEQIQAQRNEECRITVRAYLAQRSAVAQTTTTIMHRLRGEHGFTLDEVTAACAFLEGREHVRLIRSEDGNSKHYQATPAGILAWEESLV